MGCCDDEKMHERGGIPLLDDPVEKAPCDDEDTCFFYLKGRRNYTQMWLNYLSDNLSDIAANYGAVGQAITAARVDITHAQHALKRLKEELARCVRGGFVGPAAEAEMERQINRLEGDLQAGIDRLDELTGN